MDLISPPATRREALLARFRAAFDAAGIEAGEVADLIGDATREMEFGLQNGKSADHR